MNALEPGTVMPIHCRMKSSESIAIIRGKMIMRLYDNDGIITNEFIMVPSGAATGQVAEPVETVEMPMVQIETGQWRSLEVLEEGTVVFEAKDGKSFDMLSDNKPLKEKDVMKHND